MSRFSALTHRVNTRVMDFYGDPALYRPKGFAAQPIQVAFDLREVQVFDAGSGSTVDTYQVWFWISDCSFIRNYSPKIGDEIIYENHGYEVVAIAPLADGGVWVRCHQATTEKGGIQRDF